MRASLCSLFFFFFNDTATTEIYTLSLHDALPISGPAFGRDGRGDGGGVPQPQRPALPLSFGGARNAEPRLRSDDAGEGLRGGAGGSIEVSGVRCRVSGLLIGVGTVRAAGQRYFGRERRRTTR